MPPVILGNATRDWAFVVSEAGGFRSREQGVVAPDAVLVRQPGTVCGKLANGQLTPYNPAGADGSQTFAGIIGFRVDPSATPTRITYLAREAEVNSKKLVYVNALTAPQLAAVEAAMAAQQIIVRR